MFFPISALFLVLATSPADRVLLMLPHDHSIFSVFLLCAQTQPRLFWESYNFWHLTWRGFPFASAAALGISFVLQPIFCVYYANFPSRGELPPCTANMTLEPGVLIFLTSKPFRLPTQAPPSLQVSSMHPWEALAPLSGTGAYLDSA